MSGKKQVHIGSIYVLLLLTLLLSTSCNQINESANIEEEASAYTRLDHFFLAALTGEVNLPDVISEEQAQLTPPPFAEWKPRIGELMGVLRGKKTNRADWKNIERREAWLKERLTLLYKNIKDITANEMRDAIVVSQLPVTAWFSAWDRAPVKKEIVLDVPRTDSVLKEVLRDALREHDGAVLVIDEALGENIKSIAIDLADEYIMFSPYWPQAADATDPLVDYYNHIFALATALEVKPINTSATSVN